MGAIHSLKKLTILNIILPWVKFLGKMTELEVYAWQGVSHQHTWLRKMGLGKEIDGDGVWLRL